MDLAERSQLRSAVSSIADSDMPLEQKRGEIISVLSGKPGSHYGAGDTIEFCACGYPVKKVFSDGSSGPIFSLVDMEQEGRDWQAYKCPRCGVVIERLQSPA